jgi:Phage integrase family
MIHTRCAPEVRADATALIEHALSDHSGDWRPFIIGSQANDRWEMKITGPDAFERSYTLEGTAGQLRDANLDCFWIYHLRHTFASRLSAAGLSDLFVAQMMGHSTPSILQTYARVIDEYRRSAIQKLEGLRVAHESSKTSSSTAIN